jgi:outer membrane receptor protein involved in Fe transport
MWWLWSRVAVADRPSEVRAIEELSLEELLNARVDVTTRTDEAVREAAGIVTVLTAEDLRAAGCRDLLDALRLLPSIQAQVDTWNAVGLSMRGNAASDSILVLVDGHEWNEIDYGVTALGNRLPAYLIERIEVIRGPGSAVYGGFAMHAVVKVTTRAAGSFDGSRADARASWLGSGAYGHQDLGFSGGYSLGDDTRLGVSAVVGRGRRTDDLYTDVYGTTADLTDASAIDPGLLSVNVRHGGLTASGLFEWYRITHRDNFVGLLNHDRDNDFLGAYGRAAWRLPLGSGWTVTPRLSSKVQWPWRSLRDIPPALALHHRVDRTIAGVDLRGQPAEWFDLLAGGEAGMDRFHLLTEEPGAWFDGEADTTYRSAAAWAQTIVRTPWVNLTAGLRFDANDAYGTAASPRVAVTRAGGRGHLKLQVSRAFRAPGFQAARYDVGPERSTVREGEVGVRPAPWLYLTGDVFDVRVTEALVYFVRVDPDTGELTDGYENAGTTGSRGGGLSAEVREGRFSLSAGYEGYTGEGLADAELDRLDVPDAPGAHLGIATHKGTLGTSYRSGRGWSVGGVATALGPRWAITSVDATDSPVYELLPATVTLDANLQLQAIGGTPFSLALTVHDLLDMAPPYIQPYDGLHAPLPSAGRDLGLQVTARW